MSAALLHHPQSRRCSSCVHGTYLAAASKSRLANWLQAMAERLAVDTKVSILQSKAACRSWFTRLAGRVLRTVFVTLDVALLRSYQASARGHAKCAETHPFCLNCGLDLSSPCSKNWPSCAPARPSLSWPPLSRATDCVALRLRGSKTLVIVLHRRDRPSTMLPCACCCSCVYRFWMMM